MATHTPPLQARSRFHAYWGVFATAATLPNASGAALAAAQFVLEAGDVAFVTGDMLYVCTAPGTAGGADATWVSLGGGGGGGSLTFIPRSMTPQGNSSVGYSNVNLTAINAFNNQVGRVTDTGSAVWLERQIRNGLQTPVTSQGTAGQATGRQFGLGAASRFQCVFGLLTAPNSRLLLGLIDSASAQLTGGAVPSAPARPAGIWLGLDTGDMNLQLMHKQTGVVATKIDLGAAFARAANLSVLFDLSIFPGGATYSVTRLDAAGSAAGVIAGPDIPIDGAALAWQWAVGTNATGVNFAAIDCVALEIESQIP